jgi:hypothetical protein
LFGFLGGKIVADECANQTGFDRNCMTSHIEENRVQEKSISFVAPPFKFQRGTTLGQASLLQRIEVS